jgi:ABC-type multidrug transport system ATPase subunit
MQEADVMCSRVAIIVNGRLACIGTSQELKSHYSKGFNLIINIDTKERMKELHQKIEELFPGKRTLEVYGTQVSRHSCRLFVPIFKHSLTLISGASSTLFHGWPGNIRAPFQRCLSQVNIW